MLQEIGKEGSNHPFTIIAKSLLRDATLSFEALGLLCYLLSYSSNCNTSRSVISKERKIGKDKLKRLFDELITKGYMKMVWSNSENGYREVSYFFSEKPKFKIYDEIEENWQYFINCTEPSLVPKIFHNIDIFSYDNQIIIEVNNWLKSVHQSLVVIGDIGTGKTYFLWCLVKILLYKICETELIFTKFIDIDNDFINENLISKTSLNTIKKYQDIPFLFIDDFAIYQPSEIMQTHLFEILNHRWQHFKPTIIATDFNNKIKESFCNGKMFDFDTYTCIHMKGKDQRKNITFNVGDEK